MIYYKTIYKSKQLGDITIICDHESVIKILLNNKEKLDIEENNNIKIIKDTTRWLDRYFNKEKPNIKELPIKFIGSDFSKNVWQLLCEIPYGETTTYKNIAEKIAQKRNIKKMSAQAVGGAVSRNPISIIVPCHRVIGVNNDLVGYFYGLETKIKLLEHEGIIIQNGKKL